MLFVQEIRKGIISVKASVKISINDNSIDRISPSVDEIIEYNNNKLTA